VAWRRQPADLAAPLVLAPDVIGWRRAAAIGARPGARSWRALIAARSAGAIHAADADAAACLRSTAPWQVRGDATTILIRRDACALAVSLPAGVAAAISSDPPVAPPPEPGADCGVTAEGTPWCQRVEGGRSTVEVAGVRVDGLAVLAAASDSARAVVVVRRDASLVHDDVVGVETARWWPGGCPSRRSRAGRRSRSRSSLAAPTSSSTAPGSRRSRRPDRARHGAAAGEDRP
jgi:hypothetical protein